MYPQKSCGPGQGLNEREKQRERNKAEMELMQTARQINTENKQISLTHFGFPQHLAQSLVNGQCLVKNKSAQRRKTHSPRHRARTAQCGPRGPGTTTSSRLRTLSLGLEEPCAAGTFPAIGQPRPAPLGSSARPSNWSSIHPQF